MRQTQETERAFLGFMGSLAAGSLLWWVQGRLRYATFPTSAFFQPAAVQGIAAEFPASTEDEFILAAWDFVGTEIEYEPIGSDLTFVDSQVRCLKCYFPAQVLSRGKANCVGASSLLASLLTTRLPGERVAMVVGELAVDGVGGHSWVLVNRNGDWFVLEATRRPGPSPWLSLAEASAYYIPFAIITPATLTCYSEKLCISVSKCRCLDGLDIIYNRV